MLLKSYFESYNDALIYFESSLSNQANAFVVSKNNCDKVGD